MEFFFPIYEEERKTFGEATEKKRLTPPCFLFSFLFFLSPAFIFPPTSSFVRISSFNDLPEEKTKVETLL